MNNKIIIINGPNINLLGEREQSQYGSTTFDKLKAECLSKSKELGLSTEFAQSNVEGELVNIIQNAREKFDGMIINAAAFTHTSIAIRDALEIFKKPIIEVHISNIYKREEFRKKSLISDVVTGGIFGLNADGYILAIISMQKLSKMKIDKKIIKELSDYLDEFNLTELEYTEKDTKIKVSKNNISINNQTNQTLSKETSSNENLKSQNNISGIEVTSPIIGTAYHAPEPGAKKFVEVGKKIKKGDTVMIVEAMKTMNHVPSSSDGIVKKILVADGQPVEFGQTLIILE